jgi:glucan 1,3-beta-glucosidase
MKLISYLAPLSCLAAGVLATHGGRQIPQVNQVVASATQEFSSAVNFAGATNVPDAAHKHKPTPTSVPNPGSYWLADIKHQGVAAFNPDTSYQVFRNIKDFGAVGK